MHIANCWFPEEQDIYSISSVPSFLSGYFALDAATGILQYNSPGPVLANVEANTMMFFADLTSGDPMAPTCYMKPLPAEGDPELPNTRLVTI